MSDQSHGPGRPRIICGAVTGDITTVAVPVHRTGEHAGLPAADRVHRLWAAGDDDRIAAGYRHGAESFVGRRQLGPGLRVLDAASSAAP